MSTALEIAQRNAERVQRKRAAFPFATRQVDSLREFFPDAVVTHAVEGDRIFGQPIGEGVQPVLPLRGAS